MSAAYDIVGTLELKVPRTRDGHFHPQCLNVINETKNCFKVKCCNYVIRRKISIKNVVDSNPSLSNYYNEQLDKAYDVLYIKVREENRVLSKVHIAIGITKDGDREIIGFMIQSGERKDLDNILNIKENVYKVPSFAQSFRKSNPSWQ